MAVTDGEPVRFAAIPAAQLLTDLESSFRERLAHAQRELDRLGEEPETGQYRVLRAFSGWASIEEHAVRIIDRSERHVYVSVHCTRPQAMAAAIGRADDRGVTLDVLHFGRPVVRLKHGRTVAHDSTRGVIYRHHQARHVAVVADSKDVIWAVAEDGATWQSLAGQDHMLAALAKAISATISTCSGSGTTSTTFSNSGTARACSDLSETWRSRPRLRRRRPPSGAVRHQPASRATVDSCSISWLFPGRPSPSGTGSRSTWTTPRWSTGPGSRSGASPPSAPRQRVGVAAHHRRSPAVAG